MVSRDMNLKKLAPCLIFGLLLLMVLAGTTSCLDGVSRMAWERTYGERENVAYSAQQTSDGGFILCGSRSGKGIWLAKSDPEGQLEWENVYEDKDIYGGTAIENGLAVQQTSGGSYIVLGFSTGNAYGQPILKKVDSEGNLLWQQAYGGNQKYWQAFSLQETSDGGCLFVGQGDIGSNNISKAIIARVDKDGNMLWRKTYEEELNSGFNNIWRAPDGNYIVAGAKTLNPTERNGAVTWLIKIDEEGDLIWDKSLNETYSSQGRCIEQTDDSGYILAGSAATEIEGLTGSNILITRIDSDGELEWQKEYDLNDKGPYEDPVSIQQTDEGGYILTCTTGEYERASSSYFVKFDSKGNISWSRSFDEIYLRTAQQTSDGNYILAGNKYSNVPSQGIHDVGAWLAKIIGK